jgi:AcrR family transcriptional regulator
VTVQTVIGLAAEQNPAEITTTVMAERMHMTQGALFRHFPTKDAICQE